MCKNCDLLIQLQKQTCVQPMSTPLISWGRKQSRKEENLIFTWSAEGSGSQHSQYPEGCSRPKCSFFSGEDTQKENRRLCKGKDTDCRVTAIPSSNCPRGQAGVFALCEPSPSDLRSSTGTHVTVLYYGSCNEKGWKQCLDPGPAWELLVQKYLFYQNISCVTRLRNASQVVLVPELQKFISESLYLNPRSLCAPAESEAISVLKS